MSKHSFLDESQAPSPRRKRFVLGLAVALVLLHLWDNITWTEHWPISRYQMYSRIPEMDRMVQLQLVGLSQDVQHPGVDATGEITLLAEHHLPPFNNARLRAALAHLGTFTNQPTKMAAAMNNLAYLYEKARRRGDHHGPRLKALRVYSTSWKLDEWARNVDQPQAKQLLVEANIDA